MTATDPPPWDDLLAGRAATPRTLEALRAAGFADAAGAGRRLRRLLAPGGAATPAGRAWLNALLHVADPERALVGAERLAQGALAPGALLDTPPPLVEPLARVFAGSPFLTEIVLRQPQLAARLGARERLHEVKSADRFAAEAADAAAHSHAPLDALRRWQRGELLRIGASDLFELLDLASVVGQLSALAEGLVRACLAHEAADWGGPGFVVLALGKLGGGELNYSSDIDLLFVAERAPERYAAPGRRLIDALAKITAEGFLYRVDMRLRPWGRAGPLVSSLASCRQYLAREARLWERQALLKARAVAGDLELGTALLQQLRPTLCGLEAEATRAAVHSLRQSSQAQLRRSGRGWGEVKLGEGSIRDVESVVQYLQLVHGARRPEVLHPGTQAALAALSGAGLLPPEDARVLEEGYVFLRAVEHHLQIVHHRQTHTLPADARALSLLGRRLGFGGSSAGARFVERYEQHRAAVRAVYEAHLDPPRRAAGGRPSGQDEDTQRHLGRMHADYREAFTGAEIAQHVALARRLDERHVAHVLPQEATRGLWRVTVVGYDFPGALSLICGLFVVYGLDIVDGRVFTYEPAPQADPDVAERRWARFRRGHAQPRAGLPTIVDAFTVRALGTEAPDWGAYARELRTLLGWLIDGERERAQGALVRRVAGALDASVGPLQLSPVQIEIDNESGRRYTTLRITSQDTVGFLYELTHALALAGVYIARVEVEAREARVHDTLYVTDELGQKILSPDAQGRLRATTVLVKHFTHLLPHASDPRLAILHFRQFLETQLAQPDWTHTLASLERPEVLDALAQLLGASDFLWDDFLRLQHANLFPVIGDLDALVAPRPKADLRQALSQTLLEAPDADEADGRLNAFKDREMFRIDMRHILGHAQTFGQFSAELIELAEVVVDAGCELCLNRLRAEYGSPHTASGQPCPVGVLALGKFGGGELGFASDIELMFVYEENGQTRGGRSTVSTAEFYEKLVVAFLGLNRARREGVFEIDLQLRPYGRAGSLAVSLEAFAEYFAPAGPAWPYERQALIKLRPVAGSRRFGRRVAAVRDALVYGGEFDHVSAIRAMRERQRRHLVTAGSLNAKYSAGGLVDVEYLLQALQLRHGARHPAVRVPGTRDALAALARAGVISSADRQRLDEAYGFLRRLIDALRMVRGNAREVSVPPPDSEAFALLARRLGYAPAETLQHALESQLACVRDLANRLLA